MDTPEIRDAAEARRFLAQGLWLQRAAAPKAATVSPALRRALELAGGIRGLREKARAYLDIAAPECCC